jgi:hypothetical protein
MSDDGRADAVPGDRDPLIQEGTGARRDPVDSGVLRVGGVNPAEEAAHSSFEGLRWLVGILIALVAIAILGGLFFLANEANLGDSLEQPVSFSSRTPAPGE